MQCWIVPRQWDASNTNGIDTVQVAPAYGRQMPLVQKDGECRPELSGAQSNSAEADKGKIDREKAGLSIHSSGTSGFAESCFTRQPHMWQRKGCCLPLLWTTCPPSCRPNELPSPVKSCRLNRHRLSSCGNTKSRLARIPFHRSGRAEAARWNLLSRQTRCVEDPNRCSVSVPEGQIENSGLGEDEK